MHLSLDFAENLRLNLVLAFKIFNNRKTDQVSSFLKESKGLSLYTRQRFLSLYHNKIIWRKFVQLFDNVPIYRQILTTKIKRNIWQSVRRVHISIFGFCLGYGLASGDQGMSFFGLNDPELESSLPEYEPGSLDAISHAQSLSIVALALGTACGVNWKQDVGPAMDLTVNVVKKFFQFLLGSAKNLPQVHRGLSSSVGDLSTRRSSSPVVDLQLSRALGYFRMVLEVFQWDSTHRNAFSWAFHLTHGIVREVLLLRNTSAVYKIVSCIRVLKLAERVLGLVYSSGSEKLSHLSGHEPPSQQRQDRQESGTKEREENLEGATVVDSSSVKATGSQDSDTNSLNLQAQQLSLCQTHLGGSWLLLYNFTSECCKKMQRRRSSLFSVQEGEGRGTFEKKIVELLCEIQEKLQILGVKIPSNTVAKQENVEGEF